LHQCFYCCRHWWLTDIKTSWHLGAKLAPRRQLECSRHCCMGANSPRRRELD
jgi:hypothetical protein